MKSIFLLIALISLSISVNAQTATIEPPIGLYWNQTSESAQTVIVAKGGELYETVNKTTNSKIILYTDIMVGAEKYLMISNYYYQNKLTKCTLGTIQYTTWYSVKTKYKSLKETFTGKYGDPYFISEKFFSPYYEGDGYEQTAFVSESAYYCTIWKDSAGNYLLIEIDDLLNGFCINIKYESVNFTKFADDVEAAESNDL